MASFTENEEGSHEYQYLPEEYDWSDVRSIAQEDGPDPVVAIAYTDEFTELMGVFRALSFAQEHSERGLALSEALLDINPASYTVWQYRRQCLRALSKSLDDELEFLDEFAQENPKNYQIWHHRRAVAELRGDGARELAFTEDVLLVDAKNYHAWAHRQWAIKTFNLWDNELTFVEKCIDKDIRNNSAWNQRWFVVHMRPNAVLTTEVLQREIEFTFHAIEKVKKNESAWNYLRGITFKYSNVLASILERCENLIQHDAYHNNYLAVGLVADLRDAENTIESWAHAIQLFKKLIDIDTIRAKSWVRRIHNSEAKIIAAGEAQK